MEEKQWHSGTLLIREKNNMSLSCRGEIKIKNGIIRKHSFRGMPRPGIDDRWAIFFENFRVGQWIDEDKIKSLLTWGGRNNIVAEFIQDK